MKIELKGSRAAAEIMGSPRRMQRMILELEYHHIKDPQLCFDISKGLLEYVCKNILYFCNAGVSKDDLPDLMKQVLRVINLSPGEEKNAIDVTLQNIFRGFVTQAQFMGELRSKAGLISHGALDYTSELESIHSKYIILSTDALIEFLVTSSRKYWTNFEEVIDYTDNEQFNSLIDDFTSSTDEDEYLVIRNIETNEEMIRVRRSEVIFRIDENQYRDALEERIVGEDE